MGNGYYFDGPAGYGYYGDDSDEPTPTLDEIQAQMGRGRTRSPSGGMLPAYSERLRDWNAADELRRRIMRAELAQKTNRVFNLTKQQRDALAAIEHMQNLREQEAEMLEDRAAGMLPMRPMKGRR